MRWRSLCTYRQFWVWAPIYQRCLFCRPWMDLLLNACHLPWNSAFRWFGWAIHLGSLSCATSLLLTAWQLIPMPRQSTLLNRIVTGLLLDRLACVCRRIIRNLRLLLPFLFLWLLFLALSCHLLLLSRLFLQEWTLRDGWVWVSGLVDRVTMALILGSNLRAISLWKRDS